MKYLIEMDNNASAPKTETFADAGAARAFFADCRFIHSTFAAKLVSVSETGQRTTLERITH
jgi:hypothetical protein